MQRGPGALEPEKNVTRLVGSAPEDEIVEAATLIQGRSQIGSDDIGEKIEDLQNVRLTGTVRPDQDVDRRSEEHTSELQSRFDLVCRLLLEKKKTKTIT